MDIYKGLHLTNITAHVLAGSIAIILGIIALMARKGKKLHTTVGKNFMWAMLIIIITALIGVFIFKRNSILLVITVLSAYYTFSGYRTLQLKSNKLALWDIVFGISSLAAISYFLYYFKENGFYWPPATTYATVGALCTIVLYDFCKVFIPASRYGKLWLYEHIYKMIGAFTALLSAFSGTVFPHYKPYSQVLPSALGTLLAIGFLVYYIRLNNSRKMKGF